MVELNIKDYVSKRKQELKELITFAIVQVGENEASNRYIRNKKKDCEEVGIKCEWYWYPEDITEDELLAEIGDLQPYVDALMVQMPLPQHISVEKVKTAINPEKEYRLINCASLVKDDEDEALRGAQVNIFED